MTATPPQILPSVMAASMLRPVAVKRKVPFRRKKAFWLSFGFFVCVFNWNLMCGMWNSGKLANSQESTECDFFPASLRLSLSLSYSVSLLSLFSPPPICRGVLHQPSESWWRQLTDREWASNREQGLEGYIQPPASHWNNLKPSVNKWFEMKIKPS